MTSFHLVSPFFLPPQALPSFSNFSITLPLTYSFLSRTQAYEKRTKKKKKTLNTMNHPSLLSVSSLFAPSCSVPLFLTPFILFTKISEHRFPPCLSGLDSAGPQQVDSQKINVWIRNKHQQPWALRHTVWMTICLTICLPLALLSELEDILQVCVRLCRV